MIWHFLEIWLLALVAFAAGSVVGALLYIGVARSPLANLQGALADQVGDFIDGMKTRFGTGPVWRPKIRRNRIRPSAQARRASARGESASADALIEQRRPAWAVRTLNGSLADGEPVEKWSTELDDDEALAAQVMADAEAEIYDGRAGVAPMRPVGLSAPRGGIPDDLQRIRGIGRRNEELLNSLGIFHFGQIAAWTPGEARWVGAYLAFPERIERDDWVGQATILATGGDTGYVKAERRRGRDADDEG